MKYGGDLGIDKDSKAGYLYVVGHANGTKTVIRGLGKVRPTFDDPVTFNWAVPTSNDLPRTANSLTDH